MARSLPKVCPFLVTVDHDLKLKWPELPRGPNYPALPYGFINREAGFTITLHIYKQNI